jgi:ABC-2 type transport system permease protein
MSLRRVAALSLRIVRQFLRDRRTLALVFLVPLFVMTLLNFVLNSSTTGVTLAVVPPDGPAGAQIVQKMQQQLQGSGQIAIHQIAADQVDSTLKNGDADGALIFPADFTSVLASGQPVTLALRLEGSNPGVSQQLRNIITLLIGSLSQSAAPAASGQASASPQINESVSYLYAGPQYTVTDSIAPLLIGIFSFFFVFLLTSVSFLRERSQGTIERLMVSPLSRSELVLGYVAGFLIFALLQSLVILLFVLGVLRVHYAGSLPLLFLVTALLTIGGVNLGIFVSAFARNELQVVQFIPLVFVPQALLGGLFFPVNSLPVVLKQIAYIMPVTYADFALKDVMIKGFSIGDIWWELMFLVGFAVLMVVAAALSLRQERG